MRPWDLEGFNALYPGAKLQGLGGATTMGVATNRCQSGLLCRPTATAVKVPGCWTGSSAWGSVEVCCEVWVVRCWKGVSLRAPGTVMCVWGAALGV